MFFQSEAHRNAVAALNDRLPLTVLVGPAGCGKTTTLDLWCPPDGLFVTCEPGLGKLGLLQVILEQLDAGRDLYNGRQAMARLRREVRAVGVGTIVLDDAHLLYKPCLEAVDWMVQNLRIPVVLAGHSLLRFQLEKVPTLASRVDRLRVFERLTRAEVVTLLERSWRLPRREREHWEDFVWRVCEGRWVLLLRFLERLFQTCRPTLSRGPELEQALADMGCQKVA
ncbi:MAG: ATP-binding protein [Candidatus Eremiobacteraeota bacterium]|nr:ATP-binding protein [Candidatus Eremiobacteraeota bacterium]